MPVGDIYRITFFQNLDSRVECVNVYYYEMTQAADPSFGASAMAAAFDNTILNLQSLIQSNAIGYIGIEAVSMTDPTDFAFRPSLSLSELGGGLVAEPAPPFVSIGFIYRRSSRAIRNGYKRIAAPPNNEVVDGEVQGTYRAQCLTLATALGGPITNIPGNVEGQPRICRVEGGVVTLANAPVAVELRGVGTQNSRKFGRGS